MAARPPSRPGAACASARATTPPTCARTWRPTRRTPTRSLRAVFILELSYIAPLDQADPLRDEHMACIAEQTEAGRFPASGPKVPRTGGVILAKTMPRDALDDVIASDPFTREGVAAYDVMEFAAMTVAEGLEWLREG